MAADKTHLEGSAFALARWFQAPVDANSAHEEIGEDGMDVRERILNDVYHATSVACHSDGPGRKTVLAWTPAGACMIETDEAQPGLVVFDYVRHDRWGRTRFWMNASSVKSLGEHLRTLPRRNFDELFVGAVA